MGSLRQALPGGDRGFELDLKRAWRILIALPLAFALAAALTSTGGGPVPRTASAHSPQGAGALAGLPPAVHASISAALGRDDARYQATRVGRRRHGGEPTTWTRRHVQVAGSPHHDRGRVAGAVPSLRGSRL